MPRRPGGLAPAQASTSLAAGVAALAASAVVLLGGAACQTADVPAVCQTTQQLELPGTPLSLLSETHLDRIGDGFGLSGADLDRLTVRWGTIDVGGPGRDAGGSPLVGESAVRLRPAAVGPWIARTTVATPGDTILVLQVLAAANGSDAELRIVVVPDVVVGDPASPPDAPASTKIAVIPGGLGPVATPAIDFAASRSGERAGIVWVDPATGGVEVLTLSASGTPVGAPAELGRAPTVACLGFAAGKDELTVAYYTYPTPDVPSMTITELSRSGAAGDPLVLILEGHAAGCPLLTPTDAGYAIAFKDGQGAWLGLYTAPPANSLDLAPFASTAAFGGNLPPLVSLTPMPSGFGVVASRAHSAELWSLTPKGTRRPSVLTFPTIQGAIGAVSGTTAGGGVALTYADYSAVEGGVGSDGRRFFLRAACP
jgi:hypothetical protein